MQACNIYAMMNKILYIARKVKGLTEREVAAALDIAENEYKELETGIKRVTSEPAEKLAELFNVGPEYFMLNECANIGDLTEVLEKQRDLLDMPEYNQSDARVHLFIAKMGIEAFIANHKNYMLIRDQKELEKENRVLRELYEDLKKRKLSPSNKTNRKGK